MYSPLYKNIKYLDNKKKFLLSEHYQSTKKED